MQTSRLVAPDTLREKKNHYIYCIDHFSRTKKELSNPHCKTRNDCKMEWQKAEWNTILTLENVDGHVGDNRWEQVQYVPRTWIVELLEQKMNRWPCDEENQFRETPGDFVFLRKHVLLFNEQGLHAEAHAQSWRKHLLLRSTTQNFALERRSHRLPDLDCYTASSRLITRTTSLYWIMMEVLRVIGLSAIKLAFQPSDSIAIILLMISMGVDILAFKPCAFIEEHQ